MALIRKFFNQTRKPEGFLGRLIYPRLLCPRRWIWAAAADETPGNFSKNIRRRM